MKTSFLSVSLMKEKIMYAVKQLKLVTQNIASHLFQSYLSIALIMTKVDIALSIVVLTQDSTRRLVPLRML